jgi:inosine/xanthosine triphosphate pyrophosphatase family protein
MIPARIALAAEDQSSVVNTKHIEHITFVSSNKLKVAEVKLILGEEFPWALECHGLDLEEPQATPIEVSQAKCRRAGRVEERHPSII